MVTLSRLEDPSTATAFASCSQHWHQQQQQQQQHPHKQPAEAHAVKRIDCPAQDAVAVILAGVYLLSPDHLSRLDSTIKSKEETLGLRAVWHCMQADMTVGYSG